MKRFIKKNICYILPLIIVLVFLLFFIIVNLIGNKQITNFYKSSLSNVIVGRNNWQMRATIFTLDNGIKIDSDMVQRFDLKIGDSIVKTPKSYKFEVYRKADNGTYYFFRKYKLKP